ncbi:MAG: ATP-binding protein [Candidatus Aenigmatarchaeota archaeon]|nr:MAG: ATP-binding protein [Candidatus Aenigmarchaeota archaeon]
MWILEYHNPWWHNKDWEDEDKHIRDWKNQKIKWIPKWIDQIPLEPFSLNFIVGPRQVGKTTGLKLLTKRLIEKNKEPEKIIYFNAEALGNLETFRDVLKFIAENFKEGFLFIDEITAINNWEKVLKSFIDLGKFENFVITCSGSSTANLLRIPESFMGRRGKGKDIYVLPLNFSEFVEVHGIKANKTFLYSEEIRKLFEKYVNTGGFPRTINSDTTFFDDFIRELKSEINNLNKSFSIFSALISQIFYIAPSSISYLSLAQKLGISRPTLEEYLEMLEDMFIIKIIYWKNHAMVFRKEKKIMIRDPAIIKSLSLLTGKEIRKDFLYEWIVQEHLFRKFGEIYYFKNSYEIDCIAKNLKIEIKAGKPHRKYPKEVKILEKEDIPKFLIELFSK